MTDLIKRLRTERSVYDAELCDEAADRIEELERQRFCEYEDCDQQPIYCEGHAEELTADALRQYRERIEELEVEVTELCDLNKIACQQRNEAQAENERLRGAVKMAHNNLMNLQPHIAQLPGRYKPFIDSYVDVAMEALAVLEDDPQ